MNYCFTITWTNLTNNAALKKLDIKEYILHDFIYIKFKNRYCCVRNQNSGYPGMTGND